MGLYLLLFCLDRICLGYKNTMHVFTTLGGEYTHIPKCQHPNPSLEPSELRFYFHSTPTVPKRENRLKDIGKKNVSVTTFYVL